MQLDKGRNVCATCGRAVFVGHASLGFMPTGWVLLSPEIRTLHIFNQDGGWISVVGCPVEDGVVDKDSRELGDVPDGVILDVPYGATSPAELSRLHAFERVYGRI